MEMPQPSEHSSTDTSVPCTPSLMPSATTSAAAASTGLSGLAKMSIASAVAYGFFVAGSLIIMEAEPSTDANTRTQQDNASPVSEVAV
jgi:hypothetical protein